ncbi:MAG: SGNH/GDSL hydrolase family protein [Clostridia bacterium]|nr:SGNH/GDSL hydrolase family protein [Clostridia bacterium]
MKLNENVKICFLGDSITEGAGASCRENCFVSVFGRKTGAVVKNFGIGGTRIARKETPSNNPKFDQCFLDRVDEMDEDADAVVVFGGTNDFGHGNAKLGTPSDPATEEYTFYGAMRSLCLRLIRRYPTKPIVFLTPLHRKSEDATVNEIKIPCRPLCDYVAVIREVCAGYSIPVLDLFAAAGIQPKIEEQRAAYCPDGLHPNDRGAELLADKIIAYLSAL